MSTISAGNTTTTAIVQTGDISGNLIFTAVSQIMDMSSVTGAVVVPTGTTAQRPASAVNGAIRMNTTTNALEAYVGASWQVVKQGTVPVDYLVVAGGAGGGAGRGGGGGAGGYLTSSTALNVGTTYSIVVGAGGTGATAASTSRGTNGANSTISGILITSIGGGGGSSSGTVGNAGASGGSGGGGAIFGGAGGAGTSGQ
jgi:hypothetical protein